MKTTILTLTILFTLVLNVGNPEKVMGSEEPVHYTNTNYFYQQMVCDQMYLGSALFQTSHLYALFIQFCDPLGGGCGDSLDVLPHIDGIVAGAAVRNKPGLPSSAHCASEATITYQIRFEVGISVGGGFIPYQYINRSGGTSGYGCCS